MSDAIDRHLDHLFDELSGTGAAGRRTLAEAEDHLRTVQTDLVATGTDADAAAGRAVDRFGDVAVVARAERAVQRDLPGLARQLISGAWILSVAGLLAIGLSGLVAELMGRLWGAGFVSGDVDGVTYTASRCAEYVEYSPGSSCSQAAAMHHWGEVVDYRLAAGVLGLLALVAYTVVRRRGPMTGARWAAPVGPVAVVGTAAFTLAATVLGGLPFLELVLGQTTGVGADLSAGVVAGMAAVLAAGYGYRTRASFG